MAGGLMIAGDWGGSHLRLWLRDGERTLERVDGPGVGALNGQTQSEFLRLIAPWTAAGPIPVRLCGMVGSRGGWFEAPYAPCPADAADVRAATVRFEAAGCSVSIVPGLRCTNPLGAPDVMRGEETQILGALATDLSLSRGRRLLVLPGTHSKWVVIEDGRIVTFLTAPSGELFAVLRDHSSLMKACETPLEHIEAGFVRGLARVETVGAANLTHLLFETRSRQLIEGLSRAEALSFLSALLIGADVDGALSWFGDATQVTVIGEAMLNRLYAQALRARGAQATLLDGEACVLAGLDAVFAPQIDARAHALA